MKSVTVRVTKKDILTSDYTDCNDCALHKALMRKGFKNILVTSTTARFNGDLYNIKGDGSEKLVNADNLRVFKKPVESILITLES